MNYHKFTGPDGQVSAWVNLDAVYLATPSKDEKIILHTPSFTVEVDASQFEEAVSRKDSRVDAIGAFVSRLTGALDRLTVRIPTSIRLHL